MTWLNLFFGFKGRIGRKTFWLSSFIPAILYLPVMIAFFNGLMLTLKAGGMGGSRLSAADIMALQQPAIGPSGGLLALIALYIMITLNAKRLHDLGRSGWWQGMSFVGAPLAFAALILMFIPQAQMFGWLLLLASTASSLWGIWIVVQIWFFAGKPGSNDYGPSPSSGFNAAALNSEILALEAERAPISATSTVTTSVRSAVARKTPRTPSVTTVPSSGFGRRNPRIA